MQISETFLAEFEQESSRTVRRLPAAAGTKGPSQLWAERRRTPGFPRTGVSRLMPYDERLAERTRAELSGWSGVEERRRSRVPVARKHVLRCDEGPTCTAARPRGSRARIEPATHEGNGLHRQADERDGVRRSRRSPHGSCIAALAGTGGGVCADPTRKANGEGRQACSQEEIL